MVIERFPKPFMALRASRRTASKRSKRHANHVLNDSFGHSGAIAETHSLQTTEDDFAEPFCQSGQCEMLPPENAENAGNRNPDDAGAVVTTVLSQEEARAVTDNENPTNNPPLALAKGSGGGQEYTPQVRKPDCDVQAKQNLSENAVQNAVTPAITSTDAEQLADLVRCWPTLNEAIRSAILILVRNGSSTR
jgi:hypothetical protein